jgi:hypothetical protein
MAMLQTAESFRELALAIAPELAADGLAIVPHGPTWPLPPGPAYSTACGWQGHSGNVIAFVFRPWTELLLHELAHLLPVGQFDMTDAGDPWDRHGPQFIRRVLHLHHRVTTRGQVANLFECAAAGRAYGLSSIRHYAQALGDEPARMAGASFAEIEAAPLPPRFAELFASDVQSWRRQDGKWQRKPPARPECFVQLEAPGEGWLELSIWLRRSEGDVMLAKVDGPGRTNFAHRVEALLAGGIFSARVLSASLFVAAAATDAPEGRKFRLWL